MPSCSEPDNSSTCVPSGKPEGAKGCAVAVPVPMQIMGVLSERQEMYIGYIENGIVKWASNNVEQFPAPMLSVGYLPANRILPTTRRWLERWHGIGSRIAVVTPEWGVEGHWAWRENELKWFGVKKIPIIHSTRLVNQPVIVLWDRPERLAADGADSIRIIR